MGWQWQWHRLDHMQIVCTSLQTVIHASVTALNFLQAWCSSDPNQQRQSTEGEHFFKYLNCYLRQGGYVVVVVCLFFCLLAILRKNSELILLEIFREVWQADEQMIIKFWWQSRSRIRIHFDAIQVADPDPFWWQSRSRIRIHFDAIQVADPDPYRDTGKMCFGGGMQCPCASKLFKYKHFFRMQEFLKGITTSLC